MAVVAPVGVEQAARAVLVAGAGVGGDDVAGLGHGVEHQAKAAHGGADGGGEAARGELAAFLEAVGGEVGPVEDFAIGGQLGEGGGVLEKHVAPEHDGFAMAGGD